MSKKYTYICVCNDDIGIEKHIQPEELDYYLSIGYRKGKLKSTLEKVSKALTGQKPSDETRERMRIAQNRPEVRANKQLKCGKPHTEEEKAKISAFHKGRKHSKEHNENVSKALTGRHLSEETKAKISKSKKGKKIPEDVLKIRMKKSYQTRLKNDSFKTSKPEKEYYKKLCEQYGKDNVKHHYKDKERYPFYCDFYIPSEDLFIELNAHWTHGGKPFDPDDKECREKLAFWQEKAKVSKFYEQAIDTWTVRDVKKIKTAKDNNLNYLTIY